MSLLEAETRCRTTLNVARQLLNQNLITEGEYRALEQRLVAKYSAKISGLNLPKSA
ncbi:SHOCT domain-containing protein [Trueperella pyogenes]|uniref:SHOCT domain-containing protein n=1 Tax=Trueperella pyogenes TaxID=1661 RepID=UPI001430F50F|nr:SHOCT domain-containing protein [Trueperella pyogenes]